MHRSKKFGFSQNFKFALFAVSKIPVSFERLPNMAPFDILLALLECPWLWNICPSPEGHLVWIVQNFKTLSARFAAPIPRSVPLTTIVEHLRFAGPACFAGPAHSFSDSVADSRQI